MDLGVLTRGVGLVSAFVVGAGAVTLYAHSEPEPAMQAPTQRVGVEASVRPEARPITELGVTELALAGFRVRLEIEGGATFCGGSTVEGAWSVTRRSKPLAEGRVALASGPGGIEGVVTCRDGPNGRIVFRDGRLTIVPRPVFEIAPRAEPPPGERLAGFPELGPELRRTDGTERRSVLFVVTPEALEAAGGDLEIVREAIGASLASANDVFRASPARVGFASRGALLIPYRDRRRNVRDAFADLYGLEGAADPTLAPLVEALRASHGADHVCLLVGAGGSGRDHGYASIPDPGATPERHSVVRIHEVRSGDPTLAHELAHNIGWVHDHDHDHDHRHEDARRVREPAQTP